jgi:hypothetical protein
MIVLLPRQIGSSRTPCGCGGLVFQVFMLICVQSFRQVQVVQEIAILIVMIGVCTLVSNWTFAYAGGCCANVMLCCQFACALYKRWYAEAAMYRWDPMQLVRFCLLLF